MDEINFCPQCGTHGHKVLRCSEEHFFCRDCSSFYELKTPHFACPACDSVHLQKNDFPAMNGQRCFRCMRCSKLSTIQEILLHHKQSS